MIKLDILAIAAHPDDVELSCAGTLIKHVQKGQSVGIIDLTQGELGTRGTAETRKEEAMAAAKILGVAVRENAGMRDGFFINDEHHQLLLVRLIRKYRPEIVIANALSDRHPDHGKGGRLIADACFLSGLSKIHTELDGTSQPAWRPKRVFHMIQDRLLEPSFIVDITEIFELKLQAIKAFKTQFFNPESREPETYIATPDFLEQVRHRDAIMGKRIGTRYAEGFVCEHTPGITDLDRLMLPRIA